MVILESLFVVKTDELAKTKQGQAFDFGNQAGFLDNIILFLESSDPEELTMAMTNMKSLLFYRPKVSMLNSLQKMKDFGNILERNRFKDFWRSYQDSQQDLRYKEDIFKVKKKNVQK